MTDDLGPPLRYLGLLPTREHLRPKRSMPLPASLEELHEDARGCRMDPLELLVQLTICSLYAPGDPAEHYAGWRWDIREYVPYDHALTLVWWGEA